MKKNLFIKFGSIFLIIMLLLSGCSNAGTAQNDNSSATQTATKSSADNNNDSDTEEWENTGTITLGEAITYDGTGISVSGSKVSITAGGDYTVSGTLTDGMILVDTTEKVKLRLSGVNITNSSGPAIFIQNAKKAYITLTEGTKNFLTDGSNYTVDAKAALFSNDTLVIKGTGALEVTGNYKHGIASDDDIIIENGNISIKSATDGLHANNNITVDGGSITAASNSDGIESEGDVVINDGTIDITNSTEGIEAKTIMTINGGNIRINASDDGLNAANDLVINNGYIYVDCNGDGFDSNGSMTINNGTIIIYSGNNANGPVDVGDRTGTFTINGGTVIAAGGNMGVTVSDSSKQYSMWINSSLAANTLVNIAAQDGSEIVSFSPVKSTSLILYSSNKLAENATYNISTGGSHSGDSNDGVYSGGSYTAGSQLGSVTMSSISVSFGQSMGGPGGFGGGRGGKHSPLG